MRSATGGHGIISLPRRTIAIARAGGLTALGGRARYGIRQLRRPTELAAMRVDEAERPPHPWTQTAAHMVSFVSYFDLTGEELAANRAVVERFDQRTARVASATWFLPYFRHALFGGIHTILRLMDAMTRIHGVEHRVVIFDPEVPERELRRTIARSFPSLEGIDLVLVRAGQVPYGELPATDIGVCTLWTTAFALARFNDVGAKFYMVQDYEPSFYPAGSMYGLTEATYRLGFAGIVNTPGLAEIYASYGNPAVAFTPAFDIPDLPDEKPSATPGRPIQIVLYGRPSVDRNAFELVASACVLLKRRYGDRIHIVSAGEEFDPADLGLGGIIDNLGLLTTIDEVQDLYLRSDIGICFMFSRHPSYQPFEYLAAGVAPVVNVNPATSWFLRDGENCLVVEPYPSSIAAGVGTLIDDAHLRLAIADHGRQEVASGDWQREFDRIWTFITGSES